jgi:integrase
MRRGEILGLMWEDIDWDSKKIHVRHNKSFTADENDAPVSSFTKTDAGRRDLPIPSALYDVLREAFVRSTSQFVITMNNGNSLTKSSFRSLWKIVEARDLGFEVHPHLLRHTYCTTCIESGMAVKDVQHLMGHATPEMTMRVYAHYREQCRSAQTAAEVNEALCFLK